jgi:hypothetical protein
MNNERQKLLVLGLFNNTMAGKMAWKEAARDNVFQLSFSSYTVQISPSGTNSPGLYTIEIVSDEGATVDRFSDAELAQMFGSMVEEVPNFMTWDGLLRDLYVVARRTALGADKALDSILGELGKR